MIIYLKFDKMKKHSNNKKKIIKKKSQMALEFVLLFSVSIFIMSILLVSFYELNRLKADDKIESKMKDFTYSLQSEMIIASEMNNGYVRSFYLPLKVDNIEYNVTIVGSSLIITYNNINRYSKIPPVVGVLIDGHNTIYKKNDTLYLNT